MGHGHVWRGLITKVMTAIVVLLFAPIARASPSAKLVYIRATGAEACPGEAELRKAVAVRIGYDPFFPVAQKTVVAQVQRVAKGYRGKVQIVGDDGNVRGERDLSTTGDDCRELVGALALAVSIALDDLDEKAPEPPPSPQAPPPPEPEPTPSEENDEPVAPAPIAPIARTEPPETRVGLSMSLGPTVSLGTAPDVAAGATLATALRWQTFGLRLDLHGELPASKAISGGGRLATNAAVAALSACLHGRVPFVCAGTGGGVLFSSTTNITRTAHDRASLLLGSILAGADLELTQTLYLEPFAEVGASFLSARIRVDGQSAYETTPMWGLVGLHLGVILF